MSSSSSNEPRNVYTSTPFKFIVEGTAFYLHAALVSQHSRPLDRMMNGGMSESQKGYATLQDVEEGTFGRFAERINKGYYTPGEVFKCSLDEPTSEKGIVEAGKPEVLPPVPPELEPPPSVEWVVDAPPDLEPFDWMHQKLSSGKKKKKKGVVEWDSQPEESPGSQLKELFISRKAIVRQDSISIPPPLPNRDPDEDCSNVFLSHAQLYVFAETYAVQKLQTLALENLHSTLAIFTLYEERTGDIITLLRYVYAHTSESVDGVEDLRTLLMHYVGYEMDTLMKDEGFRDLMVEDGGPLLGDFMTMVKKRIN
ncbi:MAG: hypothetical protein Q9169_001594 [Polycauliona sp. 2 TL-2023]